MSGERKGHLLRKLQYEMGSMTAARTNDLCLENVEQNEPYFRKGQTLKDLYDLGLGQGDSAVVIAAGPSLRRRNPVPILMERDWKGATVIT